MKLLIGLVTVLAIVIFGGFAVALIEANHARVLEAQVALTAQQSAAVSNIALAVVVGIGALIVLAAAAGYVYLRYLRPRKRWAPGPNARFRQIEDGEQPHEALSMDMAGVVQQMVYLQVLSMMREMRQQQRLNGEDTHDLSVWYPPEGRN